MEKTQRKQSLNCLSNTPKLFDLKELLSSLKITPGQMGNMKGLIYIEGLTEKQVRQKLSHAKIIGKAQEDISKDRSAKEVLLCTKQ